MKRAPAERGQGREPFPRHTNPVTSSLNWVLPARNARTITAEHNHPLRELRPALATSFQWE